VWVPGHCDIHGNEEADALARAASSLVFVGPEPCLPLTPSSVRQREREWFKITLHRMELGDCLSLFENVAKKAQSMFDEILTEDFGGTHNWTLSIKQAFA
jgi:hypothetical protein